jgi:sugar phosphate permease
MLQVNRKLIKNELTCASIAYAIGAIGSVLILVLPIKNAVISVALATIICASMHSVNLMLIGMLPAYFSKYGNVSFMSGLLNAGTYIGSAFSSYGMAAIAEATGNWNSVIVSWIIATVIGTALCVAMIKGWTKIKED